MGWKVWGSILVGRDFLPIQTGHGAHPASCTMGTRSFPGVKYRRGMLLTTHPLLVPRSWKSRAIPLPTLWVTTGPVTGTLYLFLLYITSRFLHSWILQVTAISNKSSPIVLVVWISLHLEITGHIAPHSTISNTMNKWLFLFCMFHVFFTQHYHCTVTEKIPYMSINTKYNMCEK